MQNKSAVRGEGLVPGNRVRKYKQSGGTERRKGEGWGKSKWNGCSVSILTPSSSQNKLLAHEGAAGRVAGEGFLSSKNITDEEAAREAQGVNETLWDESTPDPKGNDSGLWDKPRVWESREVLQRRKCQRRSYGRKTKLSHHYYEIVKNLVRFLFIYIFFFFFLEWIWRNRLMWLSTIR